MVRQSHIAVGLPTRLLQVVASEASRHAEAHDEWLLDEPLAETLPAGSSIAISPYSPGPESPAQQATGGCSGGASLRPDAPKALAPIRTVWAEWQSHWWDTRPWSVVRPTLA